MAKYKYYVVDALEGLVWGTNDDHKAHMAAREDTKFIIDNERGVAMMTLNSCSAEIGITELP